MRHLICAVHALALCGASTASANVAAPQAPAAKAPVLADAVMVRRLYSGSDGESHIETIALPTVDSAPGKFIQSRLFSTDVEVGEAPPGMFVDWHGVSSPRFLIVLSGQLEIGLGDGSKHILKTGDMVLASDTIGRGHTSRTVGTEIVRSLTVRLPRDNALAPKFNPCPPGMPDAQCVAARQKADAKAKAQPPKQ